MAKSKIIKELVRGEITLQTALKQTKVLLANLDYPEIMQWIDYELSGYPSDAKLPEYRIVYGELTGSYILGNMKFQNVSISLGSMPLAEREDFIRIKFKESVAGLNHLLVSTQKSKTDLEVNLPAELFPRITKYRKGPFIAIISAKLTVSSHRISDVFSHIETKLLDILLRLEKEFGLLDDLDIDTSGKTEEELTELRKDIYVNIYLDYTNKSITVGDNNQLKNTTIASQMEGNNL